MAIFLVSAILLDFFVVSLLNQKNLDMFTILIGTWIPFALIFTTTYIIGMLMSGRRREVLI
jgi:hypothetical protein